MSNICCLPGRAGGFPEIDKLVGHRFFYVVPAKEQPRVVIWNLDSVDSAKTERLVATALNTNGYESKTENKADLLAYTRIIESTSKQISKSKILLLEFFDKIGQYKPWSGRAEFSCDQILSNEDSNCIELNFAITGLLSGFPNRNKSL